MTSSIVHNNDIIIIGGGVAGLLLAQGLKHRNIPFRVFERDSQYTTKGYRFRVVDPGVDALEETLPPHLWEILEATHPPSSPPHLPFYDSITGKQIRVIPSDNSRSYPIDRRWIRQLLCIGIEEHIQFNKPFQSYELLDDGVRVTFTDGSTTTGHTIVGADGAHSKVRNQFLPHVKLLDVERTTLWGRTPLTPEFEKRFNRPDILAQHFATLVDPRDARHPCLFAPVRWPLGGKLSSVSPALLDQEDYMFVALNFETDSSRDLSTEDARKAVAMQITEGWDEGLRSLFTMMTESSAIPVRSNRPDVVVWETDERITLLGDAIHPMSPSGGSGGLTAILDAAALTKTFQKAWKGGKWVGLKNEVGEFEVVMRDRAKKMIEHSFAGGQMFWEGKDWREYKEVQE